MTDRATIHLDNGAAFYVGKEHHGTFVAFTAFDYNSGKPFMDFYRTVIRVETEGGEIQEYGTLDYFVESGYVLSLQPVRKRILIAADSFVSAFEEVARQYLLGLR